MARIKIVLPEKFPFSTRIPVRVTDLNYGGHVGNDSLLSIIHEARVQFLKSHGFEELNAGGTGLIISRVAIEFKNEIFYGDMVKVFVAAGEFTGVAFDIFYRLEKEGDQRQLASAQTSMVCFDYQAKKICAVPTLLREKLS
jgi:acyl-CoA thioester hydrolase